MSVCLSKPAITNSPLCCSYILFAVDHQKWRKHILSVRSRCYLQIYLRCNVSSLELCCSAVSLFFVYFIYIYIFFFLFVYFYLFIYYLLFIYLFIRLFFYFYSEYIICFFYFWVCKLFSWLTGRRQHHSHWAGSVPIRAGHIDRLLRENEVSTACIGLLHTFTRPFRLLVPQVSTLGRHCVFVDCALCRCGLYRPGNAVSCTSFVSLKTSCKKCFPYRYMWKLKGATCGFAAIPHIRFWTDIPALVKVGTTIII